MQKNCAAFQDPGEWHDVRALRSRRNVLLVCPRYPLTFWSHHFAFRDIMGGNRQTFAPPLDVLTVAAFLPGSWSLRLVDENIRPVADADLAWADVVFAGANRVQMDALETLVERAHALDKPVVLGGLDPSMRPHFYDTVDYLHVGMVGDATREMILELDAARGRPAEQRVFTVERRLHVRDYPPPRYDLVKTGEYVALSLQFAVGCPFVCDFCEIGLFYGRRPMAKDPAQVLRELDSVRATGYRGVIVFVDDNFIGDLPAAREMVEALAGWQREHGHPFQFFVSASANLAGQPELMDRMYQAGFYSVFVGIETPNAKDLRAISKIQNTSRSTLDVVREIQAHRLQVFGAFILGLDTEGTDAGDNIFEFVEKAAICTPILSLLTASQGTALYERLRAEGLLIAELRKGPFLDSNVLYRRGQPEVFRQYVETYLRIYDPLNFFRRLRRNIRATRVDDRRFRRTLPLWLRLKALPRMVWHMGIRPAYRGEFWRTLLWSLFHGAFNYFAYTAFMGYHFINFALALAANPPVPVTEEAASLRGEACGDGGSGPARDYARAKDGPMVYASLARRDARIRKPGSGPAGPAGPGGLRRPAARPAPEALAGVELHN